jgi:pheromone shutdown protein TraB
VSDKIELTRSQVNFIGGFVFGFFADLEAPGFDAKNITADDIERAVSIALGSLFPVTEQVISDEIDRFIASL